MTKAQETISALGLLGLLYVAIFLHIIPVRPIIQDEVVPYLPFWGVVSFGAYLLFKLGWGVFTFNDVPEAHRELMLEIETARTTLRNQGIAID